MGGNTRWTTVLAAAMVAGGCARGTQTLTADAFIPKSGSAGPALAEAGPTEGADGTEGRVSPARGASTRASMMTPPLTSTERIAPLDPLTSIAAEKTFTEPASTLPVTQPVEPVATTETATTAPGAVPVPAPMEGGLYMTLGGVVAEVNGAPIYANQLLTLLDRQLSVKAREMDYDSFRIYARGQLERQRRELIASEAEYAAAQRLLTADDKKIIEQFAMPRFYQQKVTEAGGSVELAKRKARAEGQSFENLLEQEHRKMMQQLFYQRRILPRIQVSAADMREFYRTNLEKTYTERSQAQFRVIKIDPKRIGGSLADDLARERIKEIRQKAVNGEDFTTLASNENQDDYLKSRGGDPGGWMQRDAYRIEAVDKAVWKLQPGQVTDVIEDGGAFYIAKLEARKEGRVRPFEDQAVQDEIRETLWQQQFRILREKERQELEKEAVVRMDDALLNSALDMAMQKYKQWTSP